MMSEASVSIISMPSRQMLHHTDSRLGHIIVSMMSEQMLQYSIACLDALQTIFVLGYYEFIFVVVIIIDIVVIIFMLITVSKSSLYIS